MFSHFYTKTLSFVLIVSFVVPGTIFLYPQKANSAGTACASVVAGAVAGAIGIAAAEKLLGVTVNTASDTAANVVGGGSAFGTFFKDCIMTPIAIRLGKAMLRNITNSLVTWINSGFEGQPSFVKDFDGLITDTTDQVIGNFIDRDLGLGFLCNSFSLQIKIALAQSYLPYEQRARCTLGDIQNNVNGFVQGDNSGGWDNFLSVTTEPQNNIYGATILAQNELSQRIAQKLDIQNRKLDWGSGFRGWESCDEYETQLEADTRVSGAQGRTLSGSDIGSQLTAGSSEFDNFNKGNVVSFDGGKTSVTLPNQLPSFTKTEIQSSKPECKKMSEKTPGSVVESQLSTALGSDIRQLEVANDIDAIIGALTNQLMSQIISGAQGLLGVGKNSNGSYNSTTYSKALNPSVNTSLSKAIDSGVTQITEDSNINALLEVSDISQLSNLQSGTYWSSIRETDTVTQTKPFLYEINLLAQGPLSGVTITTTLKREGVSVPFLNIFSSTQISYGQSNTNIQTLYVNANTDASAKWTSISVDQNSGFVLRYVAPRKIDAISGSYYLDTEAVDQGGVVVASTTTKFIVQ